MAKRVLMCRIDGNFGGVEQHILTLASHYDASRYQPIIAPIANHGELEERAKAKNFECAFIPMQNKMSVRSAGNALAKIVSSHRIDLIHTFGIRSNTLAWAAHRKMNIPWVITLPNINSTDYQNAIRAQLSHWWNNFLLRRADAVHVISPHLEQYIKSIPFPPKQIYTIINGVEISPKLQSFDRMWLKDQYQLPQGSKVIGTLGRLEAVKGFDRLLQAFAEVIERHSNLYLLIMGEGSARQELQQQAESLQIENNIIFTGHTFSIWQHLVGLDLYVCSSRSEGVPYSVLEAMACGLPVISTRVGGIPGIMSDQSEGIMVPPNDTGALASAMKELIVNPQKSQTLGQNAKNRVNRQFTAAHMAMQVQFMYDDMLGKHKDE